MQVPFLKAHTFMKSTALRDDTPYSLVGWLYALSHLHNPRSKNFKSHIFSYFSPSSGHNFFLKMEAKNVVESPVMIYMTVRHNIPEEATDM
jgi:hypothetical protein